MFFMAVLLSDVDSPTGGGTAFWPRSHLANHAYFRRHPMQFDGSYLSVEPAKSGGNRAMWGPGSNVGPTPSFMTGKAGRRAKLLQTRSLAADW